MDELTDSAALRRAAVLAPSQAAAILKALRSALDNHHNAAACPFCSKDRAH